MVDTRGADGERRESAASSVEVPAGSSRDAGLYLQSRIAGALALIGFVAIAARVYPKVDVAFIQYLVLLTETALALGSLGVPNAVFFVVGRAGPRGGEALRQTTFALVAAAPVIALVVGALAVASSRPDLDLRPAVPWLAVVVVAELPTQAGTNQLIATGNARLGSAFHAGFMLLKATALLVPGLAGAGAHAVPVSLAAAAVLRLAAYALLVRRRFPPATAWLKWGALREIVALALPLGAAAIVSQLNAQIDRYVVGALLGPAAFAEYGIGSLEVPLVPIIPYAVGATLAPHYVRLYSEGRRDELLALWHNAVRKTTLVVVPLAVLFLAVAEEFVEVVAGPQYLRAAIPFRLYTLLLLHRVADFGALMQATGDSRTILLASLVALGGNALLSFPMTVAFGFWGAAGATIVATVPAIAFFWARLGRALGVPFGRLLPWGFYFATLGLSIASAGAALLATRSVTGAPLRLGVALAVFVVVTIAAGRVLRLISKADLQYAWRWLTLRLLRDEPP